MTKGEIKSTDIIQGAWINIKLNVWLENASDEKVLHELKKCSKDKTAAAQQLEGLQHDPKPTKTNYRPTTIRLPKRHKVNGCGSFSEKIATKKRIEKR